MFCVSRKRGWFPTFVQTKNCRKMKRSSFNVLFFLNPNRSLDFGEIARLCHAACFWPSRRRSGLRRGVARNRMRTEAGKMPECLIFPIRNGLGVSNDRFGLKKTKLLKNGEVSVCMRIIVMVRELKTTSARVLPRLFGVRQRNLPEAKAANHATWMLHRKCENQVTSDFL